MNMKQAGIDAAGDRNASVSWTYVWRCFLELPLDAY